MLNKIFRGTATKPKSWFNLLNDSPTNQMHNITWVYGHERSGKTYRAVVPTITSWQHLAVVIDRGDTAAYTQDFLGKKLFEFLPENTESRARWEPNSGLQCFNPKFNPLDVIRSGSEKEDAWFLAQIHLNSDHIQLSKNHRNIAIQILSDIFLSPSYHPKNMAEVGEIIRFAKGIDEFITVIETQIDLDKDAKESIYAGLVQATTIYTDPVVAKNTSVSDFSIDPFHSQGVLHLKIGKLVSTTPVKLAMALYLLQNLRQDTLFVVEKADRLGVIDFLTRHEYASNKKILITTRNHPPRPINFINIEPERRW